MRVLFPLLALLILATFVPPGPQRHEPLPAVSLVWAEPVPLDPSWPGRTTVGRLRYLGGWALRSNDPRFGGISALHVDGRSALAFSDSGWMIRFPLPAERSPMLARIGPLLDGPGSPNAKAQRDIESMWVEGSKAWIAFERSNLVWRFRLPAWRAEARAAPPAMEDWPANRGSEAMVRLRDGRFLVFAEGKGQGAPALLFDGDPAVEGTPARPLLYRPPAGYRPTDAAILLDGRLLVLNRAHRILGGFTAKLTIVRQAAGGVLEGEEIADLRPPLTVDNLEGLSVVSEQGRTILWIASDDNYLPLQRTLLMKFELVN